MDIQVTKGRVMMLKDGGWLCGIVMGFLFSGCDGGSGSSTDNSSGGGVPPPVNAAPVVNAGEDIVIGGLADAELKGVATDDGSIVSYLWQQVSGADVVLSGADSAIARLTSPAITDDEVLTFTLTVTDNGGLSSRDTITVAISPGATIDLSTFTDPALARCIAGYNWTYVYQAKDLSCFNKGLQSLEGIGQLTALNSLDLSNNPIKNFDVLSDLSALKTLFLNSTSFTDVGVLSNLTSLTDLFLEGNQITDITPLSHLRSLAQLYLEGNQITDITPLSHLISLSTLYLADNQITDIAPLSKLTSLVELYLNNNQIVGITPLRDLTNLSFLTLRGNESILCGAVGELSLLLDDGSIYMSRCGFN
jgi:hypothetical protein